MTANVAIVDESDLSVTYTGTWITDGVPAEFKRTTKVSLVEGSTMSFKFEGTSIGVYATVAAINPPDATLVFVVDDSISGTYTPPANMTADVHHQELWTSPTLTDGNHTLFITQTQTQQLGVIFIDYFLFNTTSTAVDSYFVDDTDSRIQYSAGWNQVVDQADFGHTVHGSSAAGDSVSFQFEGRSISMWGAINNGSAGNVMNASLVIDGGSPVFFVPPIQTAAVTTNNLIFNSGELSDGTHTLVVTAENDHSVWLDYFLVEPATTTSSHSSLNIAVIVGAAVGGVVLFLAILAGAFFFMRRRKRRQLYPDLPLAPTRGITPFVQFVADANAALRTPFTSSHPYTPLPESDSASASTSNTSRRKGVAPTPQLQQSSIPPRKRPIAPAQAGPSTRTEAPPQYFE
ncbi:hypothetical protein C8R45DRAFT_1006441 [Mycena sanguinolenta]|nr:hypothetical protein C8R45DRAFT_1006441 [Mycena sanguinolenta]